MKPLSQTDPYLLPAYSFKNRLLRYIWGWVYILIFRPSPRSAHIWRAGILRVFGAKIGRNVHFYPKAKIWAPWNLACEELATVADDAEIYNPSPVYIGSHAIISQGAYVCTASHDCDSPRFELFSLPISIGAYAWICARAAVMPGVTIAEGAVLGMGAIATKSLEEWRIYAGQPAREIRKRSRSIDDKSHI